MNKIFFSGIIFLTLSFFNAPAANSTNNPTQTKQKALVPRTLYEPLSEDKKNRLISMTIITKEDIRKCIGCDLIDILKRAGAQIRRLHQQFSQSSDTDVANVTLRGATYPQTLLLVDGIRQEDSMLSQPFWTSIPVHHIERIEIVKGPQSALYGDSAIGGVIHIFTQKAADCPSQKTLCFSGGTQLSNKSNTGQTAYASAHIRTDQYGLRLGIQGDKSSHTEKEEGDYKEKALTLHFDHRSEDGKWLTEGSSVIYDNFNQGEPSPPIERGNSDLMSFGTTYYMSPRLLFTTIIGYNNEKNFYGRSQTEYTSRRISIKLLGEYNFSFNEAQYTLTTGIERQKDKINSEPYDSYDYKKRHTKAAFTQMTGTQGPLTYQVAVRMDDLSGDTNEHILTWKGAASYHITKIAAHNISLRTSVGTGFRAPGFDEQFLWGGDPSLDVERATTYEIGVRMEKDTRYYLDVAAFETKLKNPVMIPVTDRLDGNATIQGLELQGKFTVGSWNGQIQYTYTDTNNTESLKLHNPFRHLGSIGIDYSVTKKLTLGAEFTHSGTRKKPSFSDRSDILDIYSFYDLNDNVRFGVALRNVEDKKYNQGAYTDGPPRSLWLNFEVVNF